MSRTTTVPGDSGEVAPRGDGRQESERPMNSATTVPRLSAEAASRGDGDRQVSVK